MPERPRISVRYHAPDLSEVILLLREFLNRPLLLECILGGDLQHMQVAENWPDSAVSFAHKHC